MRRPAFLGSVFALAAVVVACGGHDFEPPDRGERVRRALAEYSPAVFDTIAWTSEEERTTLGNAVYVERCRNCHGPLGLGQSEYARAQGLEVPSLVEPGWALAVPDSIHKAIFVGHEGGMPIYGDGSISPREIDAVAAYILGVLRPDMAGDPVR